MSNFPRIDLRTFAISFDPPGSYFSGNMVTGHVIVESSAPKPQAVMRFELNCTGIMVLDWQESKTTHYGDYRTHHFATCHVGKDLFQLQILLGGIVPGGAGFWLQPGLRCEYPFAFQLPLELLSSFEPTNHDLGDYGHVRYNVQALLNNQEANSRFTVNQIFDLNAFPGADEKGVLKGSKHLCCWCCRNGLISFVANLGRTGYVPGEVLELTLQMSNKSRTRVKALKIEIRREVEFYAPVCTGGFEVEEYRKRKKETDVVAVFQSEGLAPGQSRTYRPGPTDRIPPVPPTDLGRPPNINLQVKYLLGITLVLPCGHLNLEGEMPIIIGTVPFRKNFQQLTPASGSVDSGSKPLLIPAIPDLPPVTFEPTLPLSKKNFNPKYVTYGSGASGENVKK